MICSKPRLPNICQIVSAVTSRVQVNGGNPATLLKYMLSL